MNAFVAQAGASLLRASAWRGSVSSVRASRSRFAAVRSGRVNTPATGGSRTFLFSSPAMRVAKDGETVEVHYVGTLEDGKEFDSSRARGIPFSFTLGSGGVVPGFEDAVRGMSLKERKRVVLTPDVAYGERSDDNVISIPRERVAPEMTFESGQVVPLSNGSKATILEVDDQAIKLDANHELAGKTLIFDLELVDIVDSVLGPPKAGLERFICAAGCFWGVELAFQRVPGVKSTWVGYTQGQKKNPKYREVCSGRTGHTEGVVVDYDPNVTSFSALLEVFWERLGRSALTKNKVGNDVGTQYRSGIYFLNNEQKKLAEESAQRVSEKLGGNVVVEILPGSAKPFYVAEEYHQKYLEKGGQCAAKGDTTPIRCYG